MACCWVLTQNLLWASSSHSLAAQYEHICKSSSSIFKYNFLQNPLIHLLHWFDGKYEIMGENWSMKIRNGNSTTLTCIRSIGYLYPYSFIPLKWKAGSFFIYFQVNTLQLIDDPAGYFDVLKSRSRLSMKASMVFFFSVIQKYSYLCNPDPEFEINLMNTI